MGLPSSSINLSTVAHGENENQKLSIVDRIDNSEVSIPNPIEIFLSPQFDHALRARINR